MDQDLYVPTQDNRNLQRRLIYLFLGIFFLFSLLLFRLWYLQIASQEYYAGLSENNRIRVVPIQPRRGFIYDRNGELLATYRPSFNLYLVEEDIPDKKLLFKNLTQLIDLSPVEAETRLSSRRYATPYQPVKIKEGLSFREVAVLESNRIKLPGIRIQAEPQRHYLHGSMASHVLGYVGEITASQLQKPEFKGVLSGTVIGKAGIEKIYDVYLRAESGKKVIEVDALGHEVNILDTKEPHPSHDLYLTLDLKLQKTAEEALKDNPGAIVAMDPRNGEILAMVSHPGFDPNQLSSGITGAQWQSLSRDPGNPLTNRTMQGQYPPGSIYKIVMAAAALETRQIDPDWEITCKGRLRFGGRIYNDWKKSGHGKTNLYSSLVQSCDVFYYELGRMIDIDTIAEYSFSFGLGQPTGIELISEKPGLIPTKAWKKKAKKEIWYPGENLSAAIGQGYVSVTPLQMASMIGSVSTGGQRYQPRLVKSVRERSTGKITEFSPVRLEDVSVSAETFEVLREALSAVVSEKNGTGRRAFSGKITIAGKTGTAQVVALRPKTDTEDQPRKFRDHAWFVAFAPVEDPQIAVAILLEHGGQGGRVAAPLAKIIIEEYLKDAQSASPDRL